MISLNNTRTPTLTKEDKMGKFASADNCTGTVNTQERLRPLPPPMFSSNYYEQIICSYRELLEAYKELLQRERDGKIDLTEPSLEYTNRRNIQLENENIELKSENKTLVELVKKYEYIERRNERIEAENIKLKNDIALLRKVSGIKEGEEWLHNANGED